MLPYSMMAGGFFTKANILVPEDITLISQSPPDFIWLRNRTAWGIAGAATGFVELNWHHGMGQGQAQCLTQTTATLALTSDDLATVAGVADGISCYDTANPPVFAALAATAISQAGSAVVAMGGGTGTIAVGDTVRIYNAVGMQQISGEDFTVLAVTPGVSITISLDSSAYAAPATAAQVVKLIPGRFYPRWRWITGISQAANAVVTFSHTHDFTVGEKVSFRVPVQFGMNEINNVSATVLAIGAFTITIDVDTSGFTAFAYPTSAVAAAGISPAVCVPSASGIIPGFTPTMNLVDAFDNRNVRLIHLGASCFACAGRSSANSDIWDWAAYKFDQFNGA
jgi:hypothetical protein